MNFGRGYYKFEKRLVWLLVEGPKPFVLFVEDSIVSDNWEVVLVIEDSSIPDPTEKKRNSYWESLLKFSMTLIEIIKENRSLWFSSKARADI